jgi:predicted NBD/HSP70 family sugar kinase
VLEKRPASPDRVLAELLHQPPISRADLSRRVGVSRASVTNIIDGFLALGIIEDNIAAVSLKGRKAVGIRLVLDEFFAVLVRINRTDLTFRLCDGSGQALQTETCRFDWDIKIDALLKLIVGGVESLVTGRDRRFLLGISISILGWLLARDGQLIAHTDRFPELGKRDIREEVQAVFNDVPVFLEHDAKTSALAEYHDHVMCTNTRPACVLNIVGGIGYGGGIIINGEVFRGRGGIAGEVGHLGINFNAPRSQLENDKGPLNGLFEDYASPRALRESVSTRLLDFPMTMLTEDSTAEEIYAAFEAGDPLAVWAMNRMAQLTAYGLAGLVFVLNPDLIVLGDKFPVSRRFHDRLKDYLSRYLPAVLMEGLEVKVSRLGDDGVLFGSYLLLIQYYLRTNQLYEKVQKSRTEIQ